MTEIILDTDLDTDCDDAGALALLHALMDAGECRLLGVVCSARVAACVGAARTINAWYGRASIPVAGASEDDDGRDPGLEPYRRHRAAFSSGHFGVHAYIETLAARSHPAQPEDPVALYRRLLAAAAPGSITICAIGTLGALARLLASPPDHESPLGGIDLVRRSVRELVSMAVAPWPSGVEAFNWRMHASAAAQVIAAWPTPMTVSGAGDGCLTGARFMASASPGQPVRDAYATFLGDTARDRPSWDQIAALYAVRGLDGPYALGRDRGLDVDAADARFHWNDQVRAGPRRQVVPLASEAVLATVIEDLMIASLRGR